MAAAATTAVISAISSPSHARTPILLRFTEPPRPLLCLFHSRPLRTRSLPPRPSADFIGASAKNLGFSLGGRLVFHPRAENTKKGSGVMVDGAEEDACGESTMPERFRYLTKEAPDRPVRWPLLIALGFLIYAWRTVLWELSNWRKAVLAIAQFIGYLSKFALALIFHFIGDPITSVIRCIESAFYMIRAFYSSIVAYAPVPELTMIILLASMVLAIGEATVPESIDSQPYLLTLSGIIGFAAVRGFISEPFFWLLLFGIFGFARFIKKRDYVSSMMPAAAVLASVGEPWIRVMVIALYTALAVSQHSKQLLDRNKEIEDVPTSARRLPVPLLSLALAIGIHAAAKWAGYRHLTWMIV